MSALIACGLNHKTAPIDIREQLAFDNAKIHRSLQHLVQQGVANEAAILSTCNRTEVYCDPASQERLFNWFDEQHSLAQKTLGPHLYCHREQEAVSHMLRVASGLDSMVLGEPQILGQMKQAFMLAQTAGTLGPRLHRLFQHVFTVSKQIRTDTTIGNNALSVAYVAVTLAKRVFADLSCKHALLLGAGNTITHVAKYLAEQNLQQIYIANRTHAKAEAIALTCGGKPIGLHELATYLPQADIVVSATRSTLPIIGKGMVESTLKRRKHRPMLLLDLAVPRDIETEVGQLQDVYLYTVDDLADVIADNLRHRQDAAQKAEHIIRIQAREFMQLQARSANNAIIRAYRKSAEDLCQMELDKQLKALANGEPAEIVMQRFAKQLTNKLLHAPTLRIKQNTYTNTAELAKLAKDLFTTEIE